LFIGRKQEMKFLEDYYNRNKNDLIVVYGRRGIGKTELLRGFSKDISCLYYTARECSEKEQLLTMQKEWREDNALSGEEVSFHALLMEAAQHYSLIIFDEFNLILKNSNTFMAGIVNALKQSYPEKKLMIVLCSSSVNWVENDMVSTIGADALFISAFQKIKELTFPDIVTRFPNYSVEDCIQVYGILGGVPGYLNVWNEKRSIKENIMALFLYKDGKLYQEAQNFLKTELRELALYNTILACLSEGKLKLNDIYDRTGFSRAKISVYLKNLIELDVVEKVFSYDTDGKDNTKKGLYRIKDRFIHFWYRFVFPNLSKLENRKMEEVYQGKIAPVLEDHISTYFTNVCQEYLMLMSDFKKLDFEIVRMGQWFGKEGTIDFIGVTSQNTYFVGKSKWGNKPLDETDFETLLELVKQAQVEPDHYYLFSKNGFTNPLEVMAKGMDNLVLTDLEDL